MRTILAQRSRKPGLLSKLGVVKYPYGTESLWSVTYLGGNAWELRLRTPIHGTGAAVTSDYSFMFYSRVMETRFNHTDAAEAASTTALTVYWDWNDGNPTWPREYRIEATPRSSLVVSYMDEGGKAFAPTTHRFITTTTNTDHVYVTFRLEVLKD